MEKELGYKKAYKMTGTPGYAGDTSISKVENGPSGSHRDNNAKIGLKQAKLAPGSKIGPGKNLKEVGHGNFYW